MEVLVDLKILMRQIIVAIYKKKTNYIWPAIKGRNENDAGGSEFNKTLTSEENSNSLSLDFPWTSKLFFLW